MAFVERILKQLLKKHLSPFLLNGLDATNVKVSSGTVRLDNLELNASKLNSFLGVSGERSLGVTGGVVGHVEIAVPWDLANENITVNVSDVDLHLGHVSEEEGRKSLEASGDNLFLTNDAHDSIMDGSQSVSELSELSKLATLIDSKMQSIELSVKNVHVRLEHFSAKLGKQVALMFSLPEMSSTDATPAAGEAEEGFSSAVAGILQRELAFAEARVVLWEYDTKVKTTIATIAARGGSSEEEVGEQTQHLLKLTIMKAQSKEEATQVSLDVSIRAVTAAISPLHASVLSEVIRSLTMPGPSKPRSADSPLAADESMFASCISDSAEPVPAPAQAASEEEEFLSCEEAEEDEFLPTTGAEAETQTETFAMRGQYDLDTLQPDEDDGRIVWEREEDLQQAPLAFSLQLEIQQADLSLVPDSEIDFSCLFTDQGMSSFDLLQLSLTMARINLSHTDNNSQFMCAVDDLSVRQRAAAGADCAEEICSISSPVPEPVAEEDDEEVEPPQPSVTCSITRSGAEESDTVDTDVSLQLARVFATLDPSAFVRFRPFIVIALQHVAPLDEEEANEDEGEQADVQGEGSEAASGAVPISSPPNVVPPGGLLEPEEQPVSKTGTATRVSVAALSTVLELSHTAEGCAPARVQFSIDQPSLRSYLHSFSTGQEWEVNFSKMAGTLLSPDGPTPFFHSSIFRPGGEQQTPLRITVKEKMEEIPRPATPAGAGQWSGVSFAQMEDYQGKAAPMHSPPVHGSPISSLPAKFEGEARNPKTAKEEDIDAFRHEALEASRYVIYLVLPTIAFEIAKEDYDLLISVCSGAVDQISKALSDLPSSSPPTIAEDVSNVKPSSASLAVMMSVDQGNIILGPQTDEDVETHRFDLEFEGLNLFVIVNHKGGNVSYACTSLAGLAAKDTPIGQDTCTVLQRPPYCSSGRPVLTSIVQLDSALNTVTVSMRELAATIRIGHDWVLHIMRFLLPSAPQNTSEASEVNSPPTSLSKDLIVYLNLDDVSLDYRPSPALKSCFMFALEAWQASTEIKGGVLEPIRVLCNHCRFYTVDDVAQLRAFSPASKERAREQRCRDQALAAMGYRHVGGVDFLDVAVSMPAGEGDQLTVDLKNNLLRLDVCKDSFTVVSSLYSDLLDNLGPAVVELPEWFEDDGDDGTDPERKPDDSTPAAPPTASNPPSVLGAISLSEDYDPTVPPPSPPIDVPAKKEQPAKREQPEPAEAVEAQTQQYVVCRIEDRMEENAPGDEEKQLIAQQRLEQLLQESGALAEAPDSASIAPPAASTTITEPAVAAPPPRREASSPVLSFEPDFAEEAPPAHEPEPAHSATAHSGGLQQLEARLAGLELMDTTPAAQASTASSGAPEGAVKISADFGAALGRLAAAEDELDDFVVMCDQEPKVRIFDAVEPGKQAPALKMDIKEDWTNVVQQEDVFTLAAGCPASAVRVRLLRFNVLVAFHAGLDWAVGRVCTRSEASFVDMDLSEIDAQLDIFAATEPSLNWRLAVNVTDIEILDQLPESTWKKFLCRDVAWRRPDNTPMIEWLRENRKYDRHASLAKNRMKLSTLPLRVFADMRTLSFFSEFFSSQDGGEPSPEDEGPQPFFTRVDIAPVQLKIDFKPAATGMTKSKYQALLLHLAPLEGAQMSLRRARLRRVDGYGALAEGLKDQWFPGWQEYAGLAKGHGHLRSLVNIGESMADMVLLPVAQYRRSGRFLTGLQRGSLQFLKTVTTETLHVGSKLASGTQGLLEYGDGLLRGDGQQQQQHLQQQQQGGQAISKYAAQPSDAAEGLQQAYESLARELRTTADRIVAIPLEEYQRSGTTAYVSSVARAVPVAVFRPLVGLSEGVSRTFLGLRNQLDEQYKLETDNKYKAPGPSPP